MASRSAMVLVIFLVSVIAFCFAGAFAAMTGTYHLNFDFGNNTTNDTGFFGNLSDFNSDKGSSSSSSSVQTYSDSGSSNSHVETTEDNSHTPEPDPTPEPTPTPTPETGNRTAKKV